METWALQQEQQAERQAAAAAGGSSSSRVVSRFAAAAGAAGSSGGQGGGSPVRGMGGLLLQHGERTPVCVVGLDFSGKSNVTWGIAWTPDGTSPVLTPRRACEWEWGVVNRKGYECWESATAEAALWAATLYA